MISSDPSRLLIAWPFCPFGYVKSVSSTYGFDVGNLLNTIINAIEYNIR